MSTLVLSERPLRLWDERASRSFRGPAAPEHDAPPRHHEAPPHHHDAPPQADPATPPHRDHDAPPHARLSLADVLGAAWDGLTAGSTVACPVCHGELAPHGAGGRCRSCGTTLT